MVIFLLEVLFPLLFTGAGLLLNQRLLFYQIFPPTSQLVLEHRHNLILLWFFNTVIQLILIDPANLLFFLSVVLLNLADIDLPCFIIFADKVNEFLLYGIHSIDAGVMLDLFLMNFGQVGTKETHADVLITCVREICYFLLANVLYLFYLLTKQPDVAGPAGAHLERRGFLHLFLLEEVLPQDLTFFQLSLSGVVLVNLRVFNQLLKITVQLCVIDLIFFRVGCVFFLDVKFFINSHDHLIEAVKTVILSVADERSFLFFSDEADVLSDVAFCLSLRQVFLVVLVKVLNRREEGVVSAPLGDAGGVDWLSLYGVNGLLLFHSSLL